MAIATEKFQVKKPARNGELITVPDPEQAQRDFDANINNIFSSDVTILERPLSELRKEIQAQICQALAVPESKYYITVGHQPVFHHCGILAKYFLAQYLAENSQGRVYNFIIDTDTIDPVLALPGKDSNGNSINNIPLLVDHGLLPAEYQPSPSPWELKRLKDIFSSEYITPRYEKAAEQLIVDIENSSKTAQTISELISMINLNYAESLGLKRYDIPSSVLSETPGYMLFIYHLISNPETTWDNYNRAIAEFEKIEHQHRSPIPALKQIDDMLEMPFWITSAGYQRMPMYINKVDKSICYEREKGQFIHIKLPGGYQQLRDTILSSKIRIRPKAVTFTAFTRLFFADYFIHGIGGAYYDRITDLFIQNQFSIEPPAFACASATVQPDFDTDITVERAEKELNKAISKLRDFESNPQRYVSFADNTVEVADLLKQKMILIEKNQTLRDARGPKHEREVIFNEIKDINATVCEMMPDIREKIEEEIKKAKKQLKSAQASQYRELFFGLFAPDQLNKIFANSI